MEKQTHMKPTIGRIVHYVSHGTPVKEDGTQDYESVCRAAIVTQVPGKYDTVGQMRNSVGLAVLNPEGMFFNRAVYYSDEHDGGTWHWPEREA